MDDEKLILLVQSYKELYDKFSPNYKLAEHKIQIWRHIGEQLNRTDEQCAKRWLAIRERYSKELRRLNAPSGSEAHREKVWPLMESLCFLRNSVIPRPCRTSKNILEALQLPPASPHQASNSSQLFTSPSPPLHTLLASSSQPTSELFISLPSPSPPLQTMSSPSLQPSPLASPLMSPLLTSPQQPLPTSLLQTSSNSQAPSSSGSAPTSRKRARNVTVASEVDLDSVFLESAEHFKKACKAIEAKESSGNEAVYSFTKMIEATIAKMSSVKQSLAMERVTAVVMALQREEEAET